MSPHRIDTHPARSSRLHGETLESLSEHWTDRRLSAGLAVIRSHGDFIAGIDDRTPGAFANMRLLLPWIDLGWNGLETLRAFVSHFPREAQSHLSLQDYIQLRLIQGVLSMEDQELTIAIEHLELVLLLCGEAALHPQTIALAHFSKARCHRKRGEYEAAMTHVVAAGAAAAALSQPKLVAVFQVLEGWLSFQQQDLKKAVRLLLHAEEILRDTDDHVSLGNIFSGLGRIARREGRYEQALTQFCRSIDEYRKNNPEHRNVARSLAHSAYVRRLIAVRLQKQLDADSVQRRRPGSDHPGSDQLRPAFDKGAVRQKAENLRRHAHTELLRAAQIYGEHHTHGVATVHVYRGFLHLDLGELESASFEANQAFESGREHQDFIILARSRILQSLIESAKHEEGIEDENDLVIHAQRADDFAKEAVAFARQTQNARLLAHACIIQGFTLAGDYLNDLSAARKYCEEAATHLMPGAYDYLREDYEALKARILRTDVVDAPFRLLSRGLAANRTFQQITEDFAGILIPKVWEQEGYNISAVVRRLSISPKKVRRILQQAGLEPPRNNGGDE